MHNGRVGVHAEAQCGLSVGRTRFAVVVGVSVGFGVGGRVSRGWKRLPLGLLLWRRGWGRGRTWECGLCVLSPRTAGRLPAVGVGLACPPVAAFWWTGGFPVSWAFQRSCSGGVFCLAGPVIGPGVPLVHGVGSGWVVFFACRVYGFGLVVGQRSAS